MEILIVLLWIVFMILTVKMASRRGRSRFIAIILALLLSPLIGMLIYAAIGESRRGTERRILAEERARIEARRKLEAVRASAPRWSIPGFRRPC